MNNWLDGITEMMKPGVWDWGIAAHDIATDNNNTWILGEINLDNRSIEISKNGKIDYFNFPRPKVKKSPFSFSFSGLKTALLYYSQKTDKNEFNSNISNIAASYQEAILDCLFNALEKIPSNFPKVNDIYISGGVAANNRLRQKSIMFESIHDKNIILPKLEYCTDNAAMIAMAAYQKIKNGKVSTYDLAPIPNLKL